MKRLKQGAFVLVRWMDIEQDPNWQEKATRDALSCPIAKSPGWVDSQDKDVLRLRQTEMESGEADSLRIPVGCIVEVWRLSDPIDALLYRKGKR